MAFDFPTSPADGTTVTVGGQVYIWVAATSTWEIVPLTIPASPIPTGTQMLFLQPSAPTGWTKITAWNDCALRVVNGTSGGSLFGTANFSNVFGRTQTDGTTITSSTMGVASVGILTSSGTNPIGAVAGTNPWGKDGGWIAQDYYVTAANNVEGVRAGGGSHVHTIDMRVTYVDAIPCFKN